MNNSWLRVSFGAFFALLITTALLLFMDTLIHGKDFELETEKNKKIADIFMGDTDIDIQRQESKPKKPEQAEEPPPEIELDQFNDAQVNADALNIQPSLTVDFSLLGPGLSASDGEYLPFVKVQPLYPRRAQSRGVEGYCIVAYTVTASGSVKDVEVVDCSSRLFERASTQAAVKFKYKPRVVNGVAVEVPNVKNKFNFKLQ